MGDKSKIEWLQGGSTWNPVVGCEHVSPGCDNCYAAREASGRLAHLPAYAGLASGGRFTGHVRLLPDRLDQPKRWRKPRLIFVNSMSDLFHAGVPDEYIARVWQVMAECPQHTFIVLTKRHARMRAWVNRCKIGPGGWRTHNGLDPGPDRGLDPAKHGVIVGWDYKPKPTLPGPRGGRPAKETLLAYGWPLPNVWLVVSAEDQKRAELRIPALLDTPAAVRGVSLEPLLGPITLGSWLGTRHICPGVVMPPGSVPARAHTVDCCADPAIDWVIAGGESGAKARPMHPDWARSLRNQCEHAGVPFFFKQHGEHLSVPIEDDPAMFGGRAYTDPRGGRVAPAIREGGGPFRPGVTRLMEPGDVNGSGVLLDRNTIALRVGKKAAGRELDGRTWDEYPAAAGAVSV